MYICIVRLIIHLNSGIPPKIAKSLAAKMDPTTDIQGYLENINVRFVRLERGEFVKLQPRGDGFGDRQIDLKQILERSLKVFRTI